MPSSYQLLTTSYFPLIYIHCMRAILAGGGTGGHVIPALAIAQELQKTYAAEVLFVGTARGIENRLVPAAAITPADELSPHN